MTSSELDYIYNTLFPNKLTFTATGGSNFNISLAGVGGWTVEMNISGRWRALCASHWSLANANVVCRQLGCGVAISTPRGPHLVKGGDQILTAQFHCSGAESFMWSCPVTALGGPDCSHGNTASVICSGKREGRATGTQDAPGVICPQ